MLASARPCLSSVPCATVPKFQVNDAVICHQVGQRVHLEAGERTPGRVENVALVVGQKGHHNVILVGVEGRIKVVGAETDGGCLGAGRQRHRRWHFQDDRAGDVDQFQEEIGVGQRLSRRIVDEQVNAVAASGKRGTGDQFHADIFQHCAGKLLQIGRRRVQRHCRGRDHKTVIALRVVVGDDHQRFRVRLTVDRVLEGVARCVGGDSEMLVVAHVAAIQGQGNAQVANRQEGGRRITRAKVEAPAAALTIIPAHGPRAFAHFAAAWIGAVDGKGIGAVAAARVVTAHAWRGVVGLCPRLCWSGSAPRCGCRQSPAFAPARGPIRPPCCW